MFTLVGFSELKDTGNVLTPFLPLSDSHVKTNGYDLIVPELRQILGAIGIGTTISGMQLQAPSLRTLANFEIRPLITSMPPNTPLSVRLHKEGAIELVQNEPLNVLMSETSAGAERDFGLVWLGDGHYDRPAGEIFTIRATGATTLTTYVWSLVPITLSATLPVGRYAVVGARGESAGLLAFRFVPVGGIWRPGTLGTNTVTVYDIPEMRYGGLGTWFEFEYNLPPQVECLSVSADTTQTFWLDLVKVA